MGYGTGTLSVSGHGALGDIQWSLVRITLGTVGLLALAEGDADLAAVPGDPGVADPRVEGEGDGAVLGPAAVRLALHPRGVVERLEE